MIMTQQGYQEGNDRSWWWRVAQHIDAAQLALVNAAAHNTDDPSVIALQEQMREAQATLFYIFRAKGLMPAFGNGAAEPPRASAAAALPMVPMPPRAGAVPPGVPMPPMDVPPPPVQPPAGWMPGAWVAPPPQEVAPSSAEEPPPSVPVENAEVAEGAVAAVQSEVTAPAAPAPADSNPE